MITPAQPGRENSLHLILTQSTSHLPRPGLNLTLSVLVVMTLAGCAGLNPVTLRHEVTLDLEISQQIAESALEIYQKYVELSGNEELRQRVTEVRAEVARWRELLKEHQDGKAEETDSKK